MQIQIICMRISVSTISMKYKHTQNSIVEAHGIPITLACTHSHNQNEPNLRQCDLSLLLTKTISYKISRTIAKSGTRSEQKNIYFRWF